MAAIEAQEPAPDDEPETIRLSYDYLQSLMPNGSFVKDARTQISNNLSRSRYHTRMKINKTLDQDINPADSVFLYCMHGKCGDRRHPKKTFKATQFKSAHWNKKHKDVTLQYYHFRIFSVWDIDYEARKFKKEYIQLKTHDLTYYSPLTSPVSPPVEQPSNLSFELPSDASDSATLVSSGAIGDDDDDESEIIYSRESSNAAILANKNNSSANDALEVFGADYMHPNGWDAMDYGSDFEIKNNEISNVRKRRLSPYKGIDIGPDTVTTNSGNLDTITQKLDQILKNQNEILQNQRNIIQNSAKSKGVSYLQPKLNFSERVDVITEFGDDFINPNYSNLKITGKTLKQFANTPDGRRTVKIRKVNNEEDLFDFYCKSCHKFAVPTNNEANENYRKGFKLTQAQLEDPEIMKAKRKGLMHHFTRTEQHYKAEVLFIDYKNSWKSGLLLKMDIYYHTALHPTLSMKSFEGQMIIFYNEKKRANCDCPGCCAIGEKQNSKDMITRWRKLTYEYLNMQLLFNMSCLGTYRQNIVFLSVTMDGYDIGLFLFIFVCLFVCVEILLMFLF